MTDDPDGDEAGASVDAAIEPDDDAGHRTADAARPRPLRRLGRLGAALAVAGAVVLVIGVVAVVAGLMRHRDATRTAEHRDQAMDVASQVLVNTYSFDFSHLDESFQRIQDASTGDFLDQQKQYEPDLRKRVTEQKAVTHAVIGNAAVEDFDDDAGTGRVLFVFTAESKREKLPSVTGRQAAVVSVLRVDGVWKVSGITPVGVVVPVGESSASVQELDGGDPTPSAGATTSAPVGAAPKSPAPSSAAPKNPAPSSAAPKNPAPSGPVPAR